MADEHEALWLHSQARLTVVELAQFSGLPEDVIVELVEFGALAPLDPAGADWQFSAGCVANVRTVARLRGDLELDSGALALVLAFLERIERLEGRVRELNAQLVRPRPSGHE
jgi:chaperone modulatory protein CbpM